MNIPKMLADIQRAVLDEMERAARDVVATSSTIVPLNRFDMAHRGTLQRSVKVDRDEHGVTITYSVNEDFDYALLQHETLTFEHEPGREAKYLYKPFKQQIGSGGALRPRFEKRIRDVLARTLGRWM